MVKVGVCAFVRLCVRAYVCVGVHSLSVSVYILCTFSLCISVYIPSPYTFCIHSLSVSLSTFPLRIHSLCIHSLSVSHTLITPSGGQMVEVKIAIRGHRP